MTWSSNARPSRPVGTRSRGKIDPSAIPREGGPAQPCRTVRLPYFVSEGPKLSLPGRAPSIGGQEAPWRARPRDAQGTPTPASWAGRRVKARPVHEDLSLRTLASGEGLMRSGSSRCARRLGVHWHSGFQGNAARARASWMGFHYRWSLRCRTRCDVRNAAVAVRGRRIAHPSCPSVSANMSKLILSTPKATGRSAVK